MILMPEIEGTLSIRSSPEPFLQAFRQRVTAGLLSGGPHPRSNYVVTEGDSGHLVVRAADWWTAINVGLNRLELRRVSPDVIHYNVRYWQWARYALGLSAGLGLVGVILLLSLDVRGYIERHQSSMVPGLSIEQNLLIAWLMVLFWGFIWPWLLIAFHKRPLRGLVTRLIAEVDAKAAATPPRRRLS
jgi:hypothetical protein